MFTRLPDTVRESGRLATMVEAKWAGDAEGLSLRICGQVVGNDGRVCLKNIDCEMPATIDILRNGEEIVASAPLNMTFLPVVEVSAKKCNTDSYVMGRLRVTDPNEDGYDAVMNAGFRYRGASSTMYPKKSFAVKLYDAEGNSLDHEFFGLRNDNYSPIINGIQQPLTNDSFVDATGGRGCITLHATKPTMVRIHNMSGRLVQTVNLSRSLMQVDGLAPGIYLVGGKKVCPA